MARAGRQAALALEREDLDLVGAGGFSASASPAAGGMPWPDGPVLNLRKSVLPSISAWPGRPPRRRSRAGAPR